MKNGVNWGNGFAIGDANTKNCPSNAFVSRLMRQPSPLLPLRQTFLADGISSIQEFLFEVRFYLSKKGH